MLTVREERFLTILEVTLTRNPTAEQLKHPGYHTPLKIKADFLTKESWEKGEAERKQRWENGDGERRERREPREPREDRPRREENRERREDREDRGGERRRGRNRNE